MECENINKNDLIMGFYRGPSIIKDGLVLYLDAANTKSYPTTGITWSDLSGNGNNETLINGPTFDANNNGSIVFDGVNDYVTTPFNRGILGNQTTLISWYKYNGVSSRTYTPIFGGVEPGGGTEFFIGKNSGNTSIGVQDGNYIGDFVVGSNAFDGNYHLIVYSYDNGTGKIYLDGELKSTGSFTKCNDSEQILIGFESEGGGYYFVGNISQVQIYDRALTADEILQNYNATKSRYNL
jgi:hypothetical protein